MNRIRSLSYVWTELRRAGLFGWFFHKDIFEKETEIKTIFFKELNRTYIYQDGAMGLKVNALTLLLCN